MDCPYCGHANPLGEDVCAGCFEPLDGVIPTEPKSHIEASIEKDRLAVLRPVSPVAVPPDASLRNVIDLLASKNIGCVLVIWCDVLVGIFSERDALMKVGTRLDELGDEPIRDFMTPAPECLTPEATIAYALNRMAVGDFRHIPIERDEATVGIVSVRDVLGYVTRHFPEILSLVS